MPEPPKVSQRPQVTTTGTHQVQVQERPLSLCILKAPNQSYFETESKFKHKTYGHSLYSPQQTDFLKLGVKS